MIHLQYVPHRKASYPRHWTSIGDERVPQVDHEDLVDKRQRSTDPAGRSALQNFERLMRHVALWEHACRREIV